MARWTAPSTRRGREARRARCRSARCWSTAQGRSSPRAATGSSATTTRRPMPRCWCCARALRFGEAAQFVMPDLPDRQVETLSKGLRHDQIAVELAAEMLDPAGHVHIGADDGEIEPVAGTDIAVGHGAVMQREPGLEQRGAGRLAPIALGERGETPLRRGKRATACLPR